METNNIVFGIHTMEIKCWITSREHSEIEFYFGLDEHGKLKDRTRYYQQGITDIWFNVVNGKEKTKYYLHIKINLARILGIGNYEMMPYTAKNMKKAIVTIDKVLKKIPLTDRNNKVAKWTLERFDYGFDIYEKHATVLMELMSTSLDLSNKTKKCELREIYGRNKDELISESIRFGNNSFIYNIYVKIKDIDRNHKSITEEERKRIQYLCRIERQTLLNSIKKLAPSRKVGELTISKTVENAMKVVVDEIKIFFGTGNFYSSKSINKIYNSYVYKNYVCKDYSKWESKYKAEWYSNHQVDWHYIKRVVNRDSSLVYDKNIVKRLSDMGIAPTCIKKEYGIDYMKGVYNRIAEVYTMPRKKRKYSSFPMPHKGKDGRYRANITLYQVQGKKIVSVADKDLAKYEKKVCSKLMETYLVNAHFLQDNSKRTIIEKSMDSIRRFQEMAKTTEAKNMIDKFIKRCKELNIYLNDK